MLVIFGADHGGVVLKKALVEHASALGFKVYDAGTHSEDSVDYPDYAHTVTDLLEKHDAAFGVLICKTGIGMSISANKQANIRAALCYNEAVTRLSRQHNNANVMCLGAEYVSVTDAKKRLKIFLKTGFSGGRHMRRVRKFEKKR